MPIMSRSLYTRARSRLKNSLIKGVCPGEQGQGHVDGLRYKCSNQKRQLKHRLLPLPYSLGRLHLDSVHPASLLNL
ncbi:hypothetical protein DTO012A8_3895 [Penicillium roqueforti]|uniref:uncharacterized protein n=1 Tax=Penicillium roqueforti TaxID=5082 RepID=UPI00190C64A0|nr:uncharacterized protein LCP9604111_772 [Penicillium roqueforti]KAF9253246.1 hypothetical protein LCP9604111_772 [Penicillium roqueforti]KAI1838762.1 hypothetical protein CBS147337_487 [Penicillium roqueforti]KAI2691262.1 hypothetical protein LCP963914a_1463 [Penicillium roqueforti]KAI2731022.1 hypothetical protein CBS147354_131 [Penicillium roqueforti]KAI2746454.1 hypothetical protein DTO012A1_1285 [Penicillium roqueforti]